MFDENLSPLLESCTDAQLMPLVEFLLQPQTSLLDKDLDYLKNPKRPSTYVSALVKEIRLYGGHTLKDRISSGAPGRDWRMIVRDALLELGQKKPPLAIKRMEARVVERTLDFHFDELPKHKQDTLRKEFYAGAFFKDGISTRSPIDDFQSVDDAKTGNFDQGKVKRVLKEKAKSLVGKQVKDKLFKVGLRLAIKGAAAPVGVGMMMWDWLGPAYRVTIPVICYISYLRHLHS